MNISIVEKDLTEIDIIKLLWEKLNLIHLDKSVYFKSKYENFTFHKRHGFHIVNYILKRN